MAFRLLGAALLAAGSVHAGPAYSPELGLSVRLTLLGSSGVCGTLARADAISVACVPPAPSTAITEALLGNALTVPMLVADGPGAWAMPNSSGNGTSVLRRLALLPPAVLGTSSMAPYSPGATVSGFRTVMVENGSYVEITLEW